MHFLFRADASTESGAGHIVRCVTLAEELFRLGHSCVFVCRDLVGNLIHWVENRGLRVIRLQSNVTAEESDARACVNVILKEEPDWVVVDNYTLGTRWERMVKQAPCRILAIDDLCREHFCDLILDSDLGRTQSKGASDCYKPTHDLAPGQLLGPPFALVRPEFLNLRPQALARRKGQLHKLLVFMGSGDYVGETLKVLIALDQPKFSGLLIDVVVGAANLRKDEIARYCSGMSNARFHFQTDEIADLLLEADCAICAGGNIIQECCVLGLPTLVTIVSENQANGAAVLADLGGGRLLGWYHCLTSNHYSQALGCIECSDLLQMSQSAARIFDGLGTRRVAECLLTLRGSGPQ